MALFVSIVIFLVVLFILILVHEWGHYFAAKRTGMRVDEFGIGFPPRLLSIERGETTYALNALPIGGYVKIYGEDPTEETINDDAHRAFSARPKWAQAVVLLAGVAMNTLFAWFLFIIILMMGIPSTIAESDFDPDSSKLVVTDVLEGLPASGQIPPNTVVTNVTSDEETLAQLVPTSFSAFMAAHEDESVTITYEQQDGTVGSATIIPRSMVLADDPSRAAIGVAVTLIDTVHYSFFDAIVEATLQTWNTLIAITKGIGALFGGIFTGNADLSQVTGPVGIVGYVGDAAANGFASLLYFTAIISLNLAVINLLPVPALDGGRLIFVAIEAIIRRPLDPVWSARVNVAGFAALMLLMLVITVNDVLRLW